MLHEVGNHLWQSTLCAGAAWLLSLMLRKHRAAVRYSLWLAATVKFLAPFSVLVSAGSFFGHRSEPAPALRAIPVAVEQLRLPFRLCRPQPLSCDQIYGL